MLRLCEYGRRLRSRGELLKIGGERLAVMLSFSPEGSSMDPSLAKFARNADSFDLGAVVFGVGCGFFGVGARSWGVEGGS